MSEDKDRIVIVVPKELKKELEKEAEEQNRSLSNYIMTLLQQRKKD